MLGYPCLEVWVQGARVPLSEQQRMLGGVGCWDQPRDAQRGGGAGGASGEQDTQVGYLQSSDVAEGCDRRLWLRTLPGGCGARA